jgi:D-glycero-D-manno-heptose 1,7-bisphosphate phosphatase
MKLTPALLLDWDGTIRRSKSDSSFIKSPDDIELIPGMEERIMAFKAAGWLIIGISNQGGVAHGFKSPMDNDKEMMATFALYKKTPFDIVKMCYHMEDGNTEPYNHRSLLRKPDIGMLAIAEYESFQHGFIIDWDRSLFVGDRREDQACAYNAKIEFIMADKFVELPLEIGFDKWLKRDIVAVAKVSIPKQPQGGRPFETMEEAIIFLLPRFEGMEVLPEFQQGENFFCSFCHSQLSGGIGMKIRNELGLWNQDSSLYHHMVGVQYCNHPDDMSDKIIRAIYRKMKNK